MAPKGRDKPHTFWTAIGKGQGFVQAHRGLEDLIFPMFLSDPFTSHVTGIHRCMYNTDLFVEMGCP
jgi:hypothetical protein